MDETFLQSAFVRHYYPVLGVLNQPGSVQNDDSGSGTGLTTPYARQVGRSILRHFSEPDQPQGWDPSGGHWQVSG
ncbi:hypothetical protein EC988_008148, partial [Linderina pennispora]